MAYTGKEPLLMADRKQGYFCRPRVFTFLFVLVLFGFVYGFFWSYSTRSYNMELESELNTYKRLIRNLTFRMTKERESCKSELTKGQLCCQWKLDAEKKVAECNGRLSENADQCKKQITISTENFKKLEQESSAKLQLCSDKLAKLQELHRNVRGNSSSSSSSPSSKTRDENSIRRPPDGSNPFSRFNDGREPPELPNRRNPESGKMEIDQKNGRGSHRKPIGSPFSEISSNEKPKISKDGIGAPGFPERGLKPDGRGGFITLTTFQPTKVKPIVTLAEGQQKSFDKDKVTQKIAANMTGTGKKDKKEEHALDRVRDPPTGLKEGGKKDINGDTKDANDAKDDMEDGYEDY